MITSEHLEQERRLITGLTVYLFIFFLLVFMGHWFMPAHVLIGVFLELLMIPSLLVALLLPVFCCYRVVELRGATRMVRKPYLLVGVACLTLVVFLGLVTLLEFMGRISF